MIGIANLPRKGLDLGAVPENRFHGPKVNPYPLSPDHDPLEATCVWEHSLGDQSQTSRLGNRTDLTPKPFLLGSPILWRKKFQSEVAEVRRGSDSDICSPWLRLSEVGKATRFLDSAAVAQCVLRDRLERAPFDTKIVVSPHPHPPAVGVTRGSWPEREAVSQDVTTRIGAEVT
jgi:hypothetical protein